MTAVEFALIATPFFALIIAILQISATAFAQQALETASDKAVRQLMTGQAQTAKLTKADFKTLVCSKLPALLKCANVIIDVRTVATLSAADTSRLPVTFKSNGDIDDSSQFDPGVGGAYVVARVMYVWSVQAGPLDFDISTLSNNRRLLTAVSVFQTEPY